MNNTPDDKKSLSDADTKKIEIPSRRAGKKTLREKLNISLSELREEISMRFVVTVAGAVFACIVVIGAVLVFVDPSVAQFHTQAPTLTETPTDTVVDEERRINVKIREGLSTAEIAERLAEKDIIDSSLRFRLFARLYGYDDKFRPGAYTFTANMSDDEVFEKLLTGEKTVIRFTVPEGFGVKEIAERLYNLDLVDKEDFLKAAEDFAPYDYMRKRQNVFFAAEGFLFPDTYNVESDIDIDEILKLMAGNFDDRLTPTMRVTAEKMGLSVYDLITLASLVEREVRFPEDRPIVAQVLLKRLKLNMPLQTDATLQYLMDAPKEDVSIEDTQIDSPYNTYQHTGLPPGPIANPGMASITAVLHPADTDYLYFVADRMGHNHYAYTYEEHLNLVNHYR
ncbi:MAG: endolytic transglycosylase MltG [Selenomonadaceae bacterium]|nr:endolytic transglycosylase MltG [Selenomonadaceae bacterium]